MPVVLDHLHRVGEPRPQFGTLPRSDGTGDVAVAGHMHDHVAFLPRPVRGPAVLRLNAGDHLIAA